MDKMTNDTCGVRGRDKEINGIREFLTSKIDGHKPGILYLAGAPGTGKTMSIQIVLDQIRNITTIKLNCMRAQSSKSILTSICKKVGMKGFARYSEVELMSQLEEKFSRTETFILVLDELDQLPKSKNVNLIKTFFSWPMNTKSRLILVGIANTLNLTSRYQVINQIVGVNCRGLVDLMQKILFRPYSTQEIKSILLWYLENDENYEDSDVDPKALDMIAVKFSREKNGDIRGALNALKSAIDDTVIDKSKNNKHELVAKLTDEIINLPTPPATPVSSPCKEKTNISIVANSIKKRSKRTLYEEDTIPLTHQIIASCVYKLSSKSRLIDSRSCKNMTIKVLKEFGTGILADDDYRQILTYLETQGLIILKKVGPRDRIVLKVSDSEICDLIPEKDKICSLIDRVC